MAIAHEPTSANAEASLRARYDGVLGRLAAAAARAGRRPGDVVLVVVTKNASIDQVRQLVELGHRDFGENRVQVLAQRVAQIAEFLERRRQLSGPRAAHPPEPRWHMIGHLQRNKVRKVLPLVRLIHSLDSLRLAEEIQVASSRRDEPVEVLVEVNTSGEKGKHGVAPPAAAHLVEQLDTMMNLRPRGLMCMAALVEDPKLARPTFERCRELFEDIRSSGLGGEQFDLLSMGMSGDFEVAVECGANLVRIGTAIFGPPPPDLPEVEEEPEDV